MTGPTKEGEPGEDPLEDSFLDRALDSGFAAARESARRSFPSVLDLVQERTGARPSVCLRDVDPVGSTPMLVPLGPGDARSAGKYVVHGILGHGGVGTVHRGHDQDLGRDVAMKFLHAKYANQPAILQRFVEEAQIGGQLQHPGIVPVYELGIAGGRPFFAMKLVKGKTLARKLAERSSPAADRRTFLSIFEDVCQTMAYAHARGVVHRDLKPANVMIGSFGEVQVVDWGMGKVLHTGGIADEQRAANLPSQPSVIETVRSQGAGTRSLFGSVMGTPAYMPPEQARGDVDQMDERSDVFALGAILCEILTGQPPYVGDQDQQLGMAAMAKLDDAYARLQACGADPEVVELATRCLMPAPATRPRSAEVVAKAVHDYLATAEARAHDARVEAAEARVRATALRRTQKLGAILMSVIAACLAVSLWFWRDASSQRGLAVQAATNEKAARELADARATQARDSLAKFDRLSHVVRLAAAKARERQLHPAWPSQAAAMRTWLEGEARALQEALPELHATLAQLEARALPQTAAEQEEARRTHPRALELATLESRLVALQRARAVRSGAKRPEPFDLATTELPDTARAIDELARPLVDPHRTVFGREAEGLALARRAVALSPARGGLLAMTTETLAWALFANGLDDDAIAESAAALAAANDVQRPTLEVRIRELRAAVEAASGPDGEARVEQLAAEVAALRVEVERRRVWQFADPADRFLHDTLRELIADIDDFAQREVIAVRRRLAWAERVEQLTITRYRDRWNEARLAILAADGVTASRLYASPRFELTPQLGLVPIGMNPRTKLWEFYHLRSAWNPDGDEDPAAIAIPTHDDTGSIDVDGRGVVFVLIPGGAFLMGAQADDEDAPNFDPSASRDEGPVRRIELAPYFLARHELTQGQWARLDDGRYPSWYQVGKTYTGIPVPVGDSHPVEQVSWNMCTELLRQHGLLLPTEAQWERACRGGTSSAWSTGQSVESLERFANVLDRTGRTVAPEWPGGEAFDDHFKGPAPVGTFEPNPFGLYDAHGNVWEWCRDQRAGYVFTPRQVDGLREPSPPYAARIQRGGSHQVAARFARSASRSNLDPVFRRHDLGVRPARAIRP
ncbi:MAG: SUMF1/EgtB/PvdO family nonheme iron enzyme [Planctomycetes bacterium]|nr:SUMF1/EgtB/PvdO family nonheme iron enzyme [Planctomycetota bacterium]